jgi:hypothetical protein
MAVGKSFTGFRKNAASSRLDIYYNGTLVGTASASSFGGTGAVTSGALSSTTSITAGTALIATETLTSGTALTVTTGNSVNTAGDERITAGNLRLGAVETFLTTEPTSALVMKAGTAPAGAIATSGGVFTDGTTVKKIIAAGTVSNIQT